MAKRKTYLTRNERRIQAAIQRAVNGDGNTDDLHALLKHANTPFGQAYESVSDAYDAVTADNEQGEINIDDVASKLETALDHLRSLAITTRATF